MRNIKRLTLKEASVGLNAMMAEVEKTPGRPMCLAVSDERGDVICFYRMDGASDFLREMVFKKCYTSAQLGNNTKAIRDSIDSEGMNLAYFNHPYATTVPGGVIIVPPGTERDKIEKVGVEGAQIGACAAGGRWSLEDEQIAKVGAKAIQQLIWPQS